VSKKGRHASAVSGALKRPFDEQVKFFRGKLGNLVPTERWDDMKAGAHDRGFMVAGATKADLLTDLVAAVDRTISEGKSIGAFRKDWRTIVERRGWHGWTGEGTKHGELWRTRVIYNANMSTSYAAGRYQQLRDGGYDLWIYKHSGSQEPRPQHLDWNGLTLPKDHPYWKTHGPKNGWGCECYVVGARSERGAKRLGGDPGKQLPEGWDAIDPKTGAPVGIDKGWDYQPGRRAAAIQGIAEKLGKFDPQLQDMAIAMAEKTNASWPHQVATAYMRGVPAPARDALAIAYRGLPSVATDTRLYAQRILEGRTQLEIPEARTLGLATADDVARIAASRGVEVAGYDYMLDRSAVHKIAKGHGDDESEAPRGQRPVVAADFARLGQVLNGHNVYIGAPRIGSGVAKRTGHPLIEVAHAFGREEYVTIWEVRSGRKRLALQTMWVVRHRE
jgi:hypothetical protein